ncbi:MAG: SOS response-associated peptidase [Spirochaetota bacterium]
MSRKMCGRFCFVADEKQVKERFDVETPSLFDQVYNAAPGQNLAVIANDDPGTLSYFRWGLIPVWAKDASIGYRMINARSETVQEKSTYKRLYGKRHCLVPVSGFYEWKKTPDGKQPYLLKHVQDDLFALAGLFDEWTDKESGQVIRSFTILTTDANDYVREIHNRMPVILSRDDEAAWLSCTLPHEMVVTPFDASRMTGYPVSTAVNSPKNNSPEIIQPVAP